MVERVNKKIRHRVLEWKTLPTNLYSLDLTPSYASYASYTKFYLKHFYICMHCPSFLFVFLLFFHQQATESCFAECSSSAQNRK